MSIPIWVREHSFTPSLWKSIRATGKLKGF